MANTIKLLGAEQDLATANTIGGATCVRVVNNTAGNVLITRSGTSGTCTMLANTVEVFVKAADETLTANATVRAASIAFTN